MLGLLLCLARVLAFGLGLGLFAYIRMAQSLSCLVWHIAWQVMEAHARVWSSSWFEVFSSL